MEKTNLRQEGAVACECRCLCGNTLIVKAYRLLNGAVISCGCARSMKMREVALRARLPARDAARNILLERYKRSAKVRGIYFNLPLEKFTDLIFSNCYYCSSPPSKCPGKGKHYSAILYNGIDRIDNGIGYEVDNCITACRLCNFAKGELSTEEFYLWIRKVYKNLEEKNVW